MDKKIAIPVNNEGMLDGHFGHCKYFALIDVKNNKIISEEMVTPPPHEPGILPRWLAGKGVTHVLAGGMGNRAIRLLNEHNVDVFVGAPPMQSRDLTAGFLDGSIDFSANYCNHQTNRC